MSNSSFPDYADRRAAQCPSHVPAPRMHGAFTITTELIGRSCLYVPVPESNTLSGTALALVAMLKVADRLFVTVGLNLTLMLHDAPAASIGGQFSVIANDAG